MSSSLFGPADPSFQALPGRLKLTVRRHKFNKDFLFSAGHAGAAQEVGATEWDHGRNGATLAQLSELGKCPGIAKR